VSRLLAIPGLESQGYKRHVLHAEERVWVEKNCYVDVWIELIHALGLEPMAVLPFTVALDFEGDQWTFFKPPHDELRDLYGIDVQELNVWRPLLDHAAAYLGAGKLISTEADAFWLPDTSGTDYRRQHTKSTIILADLDLDARRLGYFHNAGYFTLEGEDFVNTFRVGFPADPSFMPLFAESVRVDGMVRRSDSDLLEYSRTLWRRHLRRLPAHNPVDRFRDRLQADLPWLQEQGLAHYHAWAFATVRQLGAAFELAAQNLRWMQRLAALPIAEPIEAFEVISTTCKSFVLKGARAVNARRTLGVEEMLKPVADAWKRGTSALTMLN
jgi:Domain of unknown function (DUF1839)